MTEPDRVDRFIIAHGCCGDVKLAELTDADFVREGGEVWVSARCSGCGATIRHLVPLRTMIDSLDELLVASGVRGGMIAFCRLIDRGDQRQIDQIIERLRRSPALLREALRIIRAVQERETQN